MFDLLIKVNYTFKLERKLPKDRVALSYSFNIPLNFYIYETRHYMNNMQYKQ